MELASQKQLLTRRFAVYRACPAVDWWEAPVVCTPTSIDALWTCGYVSVVSWCLSSNRDTSSTSGLHYNKINIDWKI